MDQIPNPVSKINNEKRDSVFKKANVKSRGSFIKIKTKKKKCCSGILRKVIQIYEKILIKLKIKKPSPPFTITINKDSRKNSLNFDDIHQLNNFIKKPFKVKKKNLNNMSIKAKNYLWIVFFVKKFLVILKAKANEKKLKRLKTYHSNVFNDVTFYNRSDSNYIMKLNNPFYNLNRSKLKDCINLIKDKNTKLINYLITNSYNCVQRIPLIDPDKFYIVIWYMILITFLLINLVNVPLDLAFDLYKSDYDYNTYFIVKIFPNYIFIFDVIISFNTIYYFRGTLIKDRLSIIKNYFTFRFFFDLLAYGPSLSLFYVDDTINPIFFLISLVFMAIKIGNVIKRTEDFFQFRDKAEGFFKLLKLISLVLYIAHICGCFWIYIGNLEIHSSDEILTWFHSAKIMESNLFEKYINSMYFSIVTMVTVGYGDISPQNKLEKIISIMMIVMACGVFAYAVNSVGSILNEMYKEDRLFKAKIYTITAYMKEKNMGIHLQSKVKKYLEYMHHQNMNQNRTLLFESLSPKLKEEVFIDIYGQVLKSNKFFKNNFSVKFLEKLSLKMKELTYAPEEIIFSKYEIDDKGIFFILKGFVDIYYTKKISDVIQEISFKILKKGESFGEVSFFNGEEKGFNAKSLSITNLGYISYHDFIEVIQHFPNDFEIFCKIRDDIKIYKKFYDFDKPCDSCGKLSHYVSACPLLTIKKDISGCIHSFLKNKIQERVKFSRTNRKMNCIGHFEAIKDKIQVFQIEKEDLCKNLINIFFTIKGNEFADKIETIQFELESALLINGSSSVIGSSPFLNIPPSQNLLMMGPSLSENITTASPLNKRRRSTLENNIGNKNSLSTPSHQMHDFSRKTSTTSTPNSKDGGFQTAANRAILNLNKIEEEVSEDEGKDDFFKKHFKYENFSSNNNKSPRNKFKEEKDLFLKITEEIANDRKRSGKDEEIKYDAFEFQMEFDIMKNYKFYYPYNNAESIIGKLLKNNQKFSKKKTFMKKKRKIVSDMNIKSISSMQISKEEEEIKESKSFK